MKIYWRLLKYIYPYKMRYFFAVLCAIGFAAFNAAIPAVIKYIIGNSYLAEVSYSWLLIFGSIVFTFLFRGLFDYGQSYYMNWVGQRITMDLRNQLYAHTQKLGLDFYSKAKTGELIARVINDVFIIQGSLTNVVSDIFKQPITILFLVGWLLYLDPVLACVSLVFFPIALFPIVQFGRRIRKASRMSQEKMADLVSILQETFTGIRVVKAFGMERHEIEKFTEENRKLFKNYMSIVRSSEIIRPIIELLGALGFAMAIWYGIKFMKPEIFASFVAALFLLYEPSKKLSKINNLIQTAVAAGKRIFFILDLNPSINEASCPETKETIENKITFNHINFSYGDETILNDISFEINKGEVVALVGPSGSGKTTLTNLLLRFYDVSKGRILIDGEDIRNLSITSLRSLMGIVTQETILFYDSVRDNIAYGDQNINMDKVENAAIVASAHEFIQQLPQGYDTVLGEKGVRLSGGQKQRIAIARALYKDSPILILDEATSSLDTESERDIQKALYELMKNRTVLVIAHRLSTIKNADRILVIDDGKIVEGGSHESLIKNDGLYKKLYQVQFID